MSTWDEKFKNVKENVKKNLSLYCFIIIGLVSVYAFHIYTDNEVAKVKADQAKIYDVKKGDELYIMKGDKLKNISNIIVVSPNSNSSKIIVVKDKTQKKIAIYESVPLESFYLYNKTVLEPFVKENTAVDFRYMANMKDIHKRLGVASDPKILDAPKNEYETSAFRGMLFNILFFALMIWMFMKFGGRSLSTSADKVEAKDITDDLDDLIGMEDIKTELLQIEDMIRNRELYAKYNVNKKFNILMSGPAGVGKTKIARCLAKRLDMPLIYSSASNLQSGYVGGGPRALKRMQKMASKYKRAFIFIDEGEVLLQSRMQNGVKDYERDTINALLAILDGVSTTKTEIFWIIASNMDEHKVAMDEAMLRRFQLKINFRLPNFEERKNILSKLIGKLDSEKVADDVDLNKISSVSSSMSPAILETLVERAGLIAIQEKSVVTQDILMRAFERVAVGLTDRETTANMDEKRLLIARHEAGHFLLKVHEALIKSKGVFSNMHDYIDVIKISTESVSKMGALGFVLSKEKELKLENLNDYENQIKQLYGGMVNEEIYYGAVGVTAGAHNDIEKVSNLLKVMVCEVGYYQNQKVNYSVLNRNGDITEKQLELIESLSERLYKESKAILSDLRPLTDLLVEKLIKDYVLDVDSALEIVEKYMGENLDFISSHYGVIEQAQVA
jgi:cell division protease FtsH